MRAELDLFAGERRGVDHLGRGDDLLEFADAAFDEGLPLARRMVLGILAQIAVAPRFRDGTDGGRALDALQLAQLLFQPLQAGSGHREFLHVAVLEP